MSTALTEEQLLSTVVGPLPPGWRFVRAKLLLTEIDERSVDGSETLFALSKERGLVPRASLEQSFAEAESLVGYKRFSPEDIVMNKMQAWNGVFGLASSSGIISPEYSIFRPASTLADPRYLTNLLRTSLYASIFAWKSRGMGTAFLRLHPELLLASPLIYPPPAQQKQIADFLDRETARIGAVLQKKQRLLEVVGERAQRVRDSLLWGDLDAEIPLMHAVDARRPVMYGIVLPGPDVPEGVPIVKGGDVSAGRLAPGQLSRTTIEIEAPYARARLRGGDVLFAIRGGVGDAAIVPKELEGANITQDVARVAPADGFQAEWLLEVMRTQTFQRRTSELITGATVRGINIRDLERIPIPWSTSERQTADLKILRPLSTTTKRLTDALMQQVRLLTEHRRALITAAVTGQIKVRGEAA